MFLRTACAAALYRHGTRLPLECRSRPSHVDPIDFTRLLEYTIFPPSSRAKDGCLGPTTPPAGSRMSESATNGGRDDTAEGRFMTDLALVAQTMTRGSATTPPSLRIGDPTERCREASPPTTFGMTRTSAVARAGRKTLSQSAVDQFRFERSGRRRTVLRTSLRTIDRAYSRPNTQRPVVARNGDTGKVVWTRGDCAAGVTTAET
jgi:hypothetical protein